MESDHKHFDLSESLSKNRWSVCLCRDIAVGLKQENESWNASTYLTTGFWATKERETHIFNLNDTCWAIQTSYSNLNRSLLSLIDFGFAISWSKLCSHASISSLITLHKVCPPAKAIYHVHSMVGGISNKSDSNKSPMRPNKTCVVIALSQL